MRGEAVLEGQDQQLACSLLFLSSQALLSEGPGESNQRHAAMHWGTHVPQSVILRLSIHLLQDKISPGIPFSGFLRVWFGDFCCCCYFVVLLWVFLKNVHSSLNESLAELMLLSSK